MPAAVSITSTSMPEPIALKAWISPACSRRLSEAIDCVPEDAGMMRMPPGPSSMMSSRPQSPASTSARLRLGRRPSSTSTLASPRSASSSTTRAPALGQRDAEIDGDAGLAHTALAAGDGDDLDRPAGPVSGIHSPFLALGMITLF